MPYWSSCTKQQYRVMRKYQRFENRRWDVQSGRCPSIGMDGELHLPKVWAMWGRIIQIERTLDVLALCQAYCEYDRRYENDYLFIQRRYKVPKRYWEYKLWKWKQKPQNKSGVSIPTD